MAYTYKREMTITHADFFRLLPGALGSTDYSINGNAVHFSDAGLSMQITLSAEQNWSIGSLSLPKTVVDVVIKNCDEQTASLRMGKFDRSYQKGGG